MKVVASGLWVGVVLTVTVISIARIEAQTVVERYKTEAEYLARLNQLGHNVINEGFESAAWDAARTIGLSFQSQPTITSQGLTWETAARDLWPNPYSSKVYGVTTNSNWARSGNWGIFEDHQGDVVPTTIRVNSAVPIYGIGGWFDTNPDLQDFGFLFEGATTATDPGYVMPGFGAMYPADNAGTAHRFAGLIVPGGFTNVVLTGTLQVNEQNALEGGAIYGADDFTFAFAPVPEPSTYVLLLALLGSAMVWQGCRWTRRQEGH